MTAASTMRLSRPTRRTTALVALAVSWLSCGMLAAGETSACGVGVRPQDQVWLVSHRGLGCGEQPLDKLSYWRYDRGAGWTRSSFEEFQAADDAEPATTIFIHGNRISAGAAFSRGLAAYRALARSADERPLRFIAWSWPSEQIHGAIDDVRIKAARTGPSAWHLARFVDRLNPDAPLSLWGYSFGARVATGALHLLGGGRIGRYGALERTHARRPPMQVVLVAAALDNHWLLAGRAHGRALSQVSHLLLVNNSCDGVLKRYHWVYHRRACQQALGYTGLSSRSIDGDAQAKIEQFDACCQVGREHAFANYLCAAGVMARIRRGLLLDKTFGPDASNEALAAVDVAE